MNIGLVFAPADLPYAEQLIACLAKLEVAVHADPVTEGPYRGVSAFNLDKALDRSNDLCLALVSAPFAQHYLGNEVLRASLGQALHQLWVGVISEDEMDAFPVVLSAINRRVEFSRSNPSEAAALLKQAIVDARAARPRQPRRRADDQFDEMIATFAEFEDLRSVTLLGTLFDSARSGAWVFRSEHKVNKRDASLFVVLGPEAPVEKTVGAFVEKFRDLIQLPTTILIAGSADQPNTKLEFIRTSFAPVLGKVEVSTFEHYVAKVATLRFREAAPRAGKSLYVPLGATRRLGASQTTAVRAADAETLVYDWAFREADQPIMLIVGDGGQGKTHFAEHLHSTLPNVITILIHSHDFLSRTRRHHDGLEDLTLFGLCREAGQIDARLTERMFHAAWRNRKVLVIIDGLDEIALGIDRSEDIRAFFNSVNEGDINGLGKVLVTSRKNFTQEAVDDNTPVLELKLFDRSQARQFFTDTFRTWLPNDANLDASAKQLTDRAMQWAELVAEPGPPLQYLPFALELIAESFRSDSSSADGDGAVSASPASPETPLALRRHLSTKDLIFQICRRESKRIQLFERQSGAKAETYIPAEVQVQLLTEIAEENSEFMKQRTFREVCEAVLLDDFHPRIAEFLTSHPALRTMPVGPNFEQHVTLRHDAIRDCLLIESIVESLASLGGDDDGRRARSFVFPIIAARVDLRSGFGAALAGRLRQKLDSEQAARALKRCIAQAPREFEMRPASSRRAISALYLLGVLIELGRGGSLKDDASQRVMVALFGSGRKKIDGLCLTSPCDFSDGGSIRLDFSGLRIANAHFDGFAGFWRCGFSEQTRFESCSFKNIPAKPSNTPALEGSLFSNDHNEMDAIFSRSIGAHRTEHGVRIAEEALSRFLLLFGDPDVMWRPLNRKHVEREYRAAAFCEKSFDEFFAIATTSRVLSPRTIRGEPFVDIHPDSRESIRKFTRQGLETREIKELLAQLAQSSP